MDYKDHALKSLGKINQEQPRFLNEHWEIISPMIWKLHFWFDEFFGSPGYDSVYTLWYHREVRHHLEGIWLAIDKFTKKYGQEYEKIIRQAAEDHVWDDFGEIPSKAECTRRYLRDKRGW